MERLLRPLLLLLLAWTVPAGAHLSPNSSVSLDFRRDRVEAELLIPASELALALEPRQSAADYVLAHFGARAADGRPWSVAILSQERLTDRWGSDLRLTLRLTPPAGADPAFLRLRDDAVTQVSTNHYILVFVRSDFRGGILASRPHLLGAIQQPRTGLVVDRRAGGKMRGFASAVALGISHFLAGRDHQLFLIALMLTAPLAASGRAWRGFAGTKRSCRSLALVVTFFTIGHSLTLIAGACLGWSLPAAIVEPLIAASVLVAAAHALRPVFAGREAWIAAAFGLVHGLAFAGIIADFDLDRADRLLCILGFNVGIEIVQLALAAVALVPLLALARTPFYPPFRLTAGYLVMAIAWIWLVERLANGGGGLAPLDRLLDWGPTAIFALALAFAAAFGLRGRFALANLDEAPRVRGG